MIYTIKGRIASKKNNKQVFRKGGRVIVTSSKAWKRFEKDALEQIKKQKKRQKTISGNVFIDYTFLMKGKGNTDTSNMITSTDDILEKAGILENDRQITSGSFRRIHNKIHNWWHGIKPLHCDGCYNVGVNRDGYIVKMDWDQRFEYLSRKFEPSKKKEFEILNGKLIVDKQLRFILKNHDK